MEAVFRVELKIKALQASALPLGYTAMVQKNEGNPSILPALYAIYVTRKGFCQMEAAPGIEPGVKVLQTSALPLGYAAIGAENGTRTRDPHLGKVMLYH